MARLGEARYGKDNVRVYKVHRNKETGVQDVTEMTVCCLLEGRIDESYTTANNAPIVATDSIKNTIYIIARQHPVNPPELYASILGRHFLHTYPHINAATVSVTVHRWARMQIGDEGAEATPHPHSFFRDGEDTRRVEAVVRRSDDDKKVIVNLTSGIKGLTVLKSTGSAFHGFLRDEYTTLPETHDRILSTEVDCTWSWDPISLSAHDIMSTFTKNEFLSAGSKRYDEAWEAARRITMRTFARDESASVQNTMYKMGEEILGAVEGVKSVKYCLPNKHYFEVDLSWHKGLKNTGEEAEVYAPQSGPNGLIFCEVTRD